MHTILIFISCIVGCGLSLFMLYRKLSHRRLACPREHPCDTVLHSRFSKTLGIPNELLGALYFAVVGTLLLTPSIGMTTTYLLYALFLIVLIGGLFSLYLIGLQAFVIRSWCLWCIGVGIANIVLVTTLLIYFPYEQITTLFASHKTLWTIIHTLGFILGVGATTITDVFFFRFLKDNSISQEEKETMDTLTSVIWVGLAVLVVSGVALYLSDIPRLSVSPKFLIKVVVVSVIITNGVLLNMLVAPHLRRLSFEGTVPARRFRRLAFALGGISLTSWYIAFFLGSFRNIPVDFSTALWAYCTLLVCVIIGSQIAERILSRSRARPSPDFLV